jgi:hypothetical protein
MLVVIAGVVLLFTARHPRSIFYFVIGLDRWVARVAAYAFLMRDEYPTCRLDTRERESASGAVACSEVPGPPPGDEGVTERRRPAAAAAAQPTLRR